jgi:glycosyltransferase involved in cell wall biosynthesis
MVNKPCAVNVTPRNSPCPCGSGKRFKECHGAVATSLIAPASPESKLARLNRALEAQRLSKLDEAAHLYESVLSEEPQHFDAKHMLGVVRLEQNRASEATRLILEALESVEWRVAAAVQNLALAVGKALSPNQAQYGIGALGRSYRERIFLADNAIAEANPPLVSVVMPSFNHASYIEAAIHSVRQQSYDNWELIIIDDGSTDNSAEILRKLTAENDPRIVVRSRENRGAHATLNELIALAKGTWIQPLNSDDQLSHQRLSRMLRAVKYFGAEWGFGGVRAIDAQGAAIDEMKNARAFALRSQQSEIPMFETLSQSFFSSNPAISTGNLFFSKSLFNKLGGFDDLRYHHDWDFCLKAAHRSEPFFDDEVSYWYRLHDSNTISEQSAHKYPELTSMMRRHIDVALSTSAPNPWMPSYDRCGVSFISHLLSRGLGEVIDRAFLRSVAQRAISDARQ